MLCSEVVAPTLFRILSLSLGFQRENVMVDCFCAFEGTLHCQKEAKILWVCGKTVFLYLKPRILS